MIITTFVQFQFQCSFNPFIYLIKFILIGVSRGMKYLHDRNIIRRDIKPGYILLDKDFQPHITDFGMSKFFRFDNSKEQSKAGGAYSYMAPEIIEDLEYGRKVDVYSFAILMCEVVTNLVPYPDLVNGNIDAFIFQNKVVHEYYRQTFENHVKIKENLKQLIERSWSKEPDIRPTFSELFRMLSNNEYFLDDVDDKKIKSYIEKITEINDPINELNNEIEN